jgi:hypothetical protein
VVWRTAGRKGWLLVPGGQGAGTASEASAVLLLALLVMESHMQMPMPLRLALACQRLRQTLDLRGERLLAHAWAGPPLEPTPGTRMLPLDRPLDRPLLGGELLGRCARGGPSFAAARACTTTRNFSAIGRSRVIPSVALRSSQYVRAWFCSLMRSRAARVVSTCCIVALIFPLAR